MKTLFDLLHESHEIQRSLCRQMTAARATTAKRADTFFQLKVELEAHAAAEERFLYVPLLLTDGGLSASRHALSEHHSIEELCEDLSVADKASSMWLDTAQKLGEKVRHHLKEEERKFFKVAGRLLDDKQKATLAKRYERDLVRMRRKLADEYKTIDVTPDGMVESLKTGTLAGKPVAKKAAAKKVAAKKAAAKKVAVKAAAKKVPAKKVPATKAATTRSAMKKAPVRQ